MTRGGADEVLLIRSVDVDEAVPGIRIGALETVEPEDAGEDVIFVAAGVGDGAGGLASAKNHPRLGILPDFFGNPELSEGRAIAVRFGAESELRRGDWIARDGSPAVEKVEALVGDRDADSWRKSRLDRG